MKKCISIYIYISHWKNWVSSQLLAINLHAKLLSRCGLIIVRIYCIMQLDCTTSLRKVADIRYECLSEFFFKINSWLLKNKLWAIKILLDFKQSICNMARKYTFTHHKIKVEIRTTKIVHSMRTTYLYASISALRVPIQL